MTFVTFAHAGSSPRAAREDGRVGRRRVVSMLQGGIGCAPGETRLPSSNLKGRARRSELGRFLRVGRVRLSLMATAPN